MTSNDDNATLYTLGDRGQTIEGGADDIRGREVKDKDGEGIGRVADLLIDEREKKVRFLLVEHGGFLGFGEKKTLIPVDAVTKISESEVFIDQTRERVADAPSYDPGLADDRPYHSELFGYYGYPAYWGDGYTYPMGLWGMHPGTPARPRD